MKSRLAAAIPIAKSIKDNLEMFYLTEGRYPTNAEFPDMVDFADKNCFRSICRVGNYLVEYMSSPLVAVLYSPGSAMTASSPTERFGAGIVTNSFTNNIPVLACVAGGTKSVQMCRSYPYAHQSLKGLAIGIVSFYKM
ncbi:MAG: hypothetical protein PUC11_05820 [Elusimicrobia bacterium]|nr:hypothetical protein [Elusimicrobiota bacterium]